MFTYTVMNSPRSDCVLVNSASRECSRYVISKTNKIVPLACVFMPRARTELITSPQVT